MLRSFSVRNRAGAHEPVARGYHAVYRENQVNRCPGCGRSHWLVGRILAECGFCQTALPLAEATARGPGTYHRRNARPEIFLDAA